MSHTLLLADDSVTIQRVIELTFADEDIKVIAVSDGDQAIARLESSPPDIVLADIGMPGRNGYEVAQYIKQSPKLSKIPVVLLTGAFEPVDQARAAEAGCDGILAKPFEPQLVISRVKELLLSGPIRSAAPPVPVHAPSAPPPAAAPSVPSAPPSSPQSGPQSAPLAAPPAPTKTKEYFERLDEAFTSAAAAPPQALVTASKLSKPAAKPAVEAKPEPMLDLPIARPAPSAPPADLPLAVNPPAPAPAAAQPAAKAAEPPAPEPAPAAAEVQDAPTGAITVAVARPLTDAHTDRAQAPGAEARGEKAPPLPAHPIPMPSLADAFAALLAAEQAEPLPPSVPMWPASGPPIDLVADQVVRRVLEQMSDRIVRETVASLVSEITERLVREEIEKIKASVKP